MINKKLLAALIVLIAIIGAGAAWVIWGTFTEAPEEAGAEDTLRIRSLSVNPSQGSGQFVLTADYVAPATEQTTLACSYPKGWVPTVDPATGRTVQVYQTADLQAVSIPPQSATGRETDSTTIAFTETRPGQYVISCTSRPVPISGSTSASFSVLRTAAEQPPAETPQQTRSRDGITIVPIPIDRDRQEPTPTPAPQQPQVPQQPPAQQPPQFVPVPVPVPQPGNDVADQPSGADGADGAAGPPETAPADDGGDGDN